MVNGRLPASALAPISTAVNGQRAYLQKDAARAFNAMNILATGGYHTTLRTSSARAAYRPYADQLYFWNLYLSGRGNLAARPGSSNHGWGLAVDLASPRMRQIVDAVGSNFGWAKRWSDAPSEWWHLKYRSGIWNGKAPHTTRPTLRPGTKAAKVRQVQGLLRKKGFKSVTVTGYYGKATLSAVKRLQKAHHLTPDGIIGPSTWKALIGH